MKLFVGRVLAAGVLVSAVAAAAEAQPLRASPYLSVSDVGGPYAGEAPEYVPPPHYGPMPLLPPREVFMIIRENGFAPLGPPQPRGMFYTMAVIDRDGQDGRLVIDARDGRILRFLPAFRTSERMDGVAVAEMPMSRPPAPVPQAYVPPAQAAAPLPPSMSGPIGAPRTMPTARRLANQSPSVPLPRPVPRAVAEPYPPRAVAEPKPAEPVVAAPVPVAPAPPQQSAAAQSKPAEASPPTLTTGQAAAAKPSGQIMPTQPMPQVQGLD